MKYSVVIIGGGASGLMCAVTAAKRGVQVLVIDHQERIGSKIRISGGGRCNFTNKSVVATNFVSSNPHFVKSAISKFSPDDFIELMGKYKISFEEKNNGELFCEKSALEIIKMLEAECVNNGVEIITGAQIQTISHDKQFGIKTSGGVMEADSLVVATGGLSYESMGASDFGLQVARQFGLAVTALGPALVPLIFSKSDRKIYSGLSGISFKGKVSCGKKSFLGDILFTHRGLSGPAILQISSYLSEGGPITIDVFPETDILAVLSKEKTKGAKLLPKNILKRFISENMARVTCERAGLTDLLNTYSEKHLRMCAEKLHHWQVTPVGTEGYDKAEATRGGVDTAEVSSKTMESVKVKNLYFIGEVLDVVGQLGGYNLHWAWASGFAAGKAIKKAPGD